MMRAAVVSDQKENYQKQRTAAKSAPPIMRLPIDLIVSILEALTWDYSARYCNGLAWQRDLAVMALVCKAFRAPARALLWRSPER